ncbi:MAG: hypothetical protein K8F92_00610 [Hyphomicrobium sp.]|uniref:hypothetical protein n=1 Tax=Hyphomicrobium sp. TaxID=82 RepID=UPI0013233114|nr:MAG: hypothetical protein F9K20_17475 [Hyphomicrobium sp.]MBZ0208146.1 hypothetical protein [Hyphomicrobium sp.]
MKPLIEPCEKVGDAGYGAGQWQHAAELGIDERQHQRHAAADQPRDNGGGASDLSGIERGEQPARADDAGNAGEQEGEGADLPLQGTMLARSLFEHAPPPKWPRECA